MYRTRARIGLLVPSDNTIIEPKFNALTPEGVSVHAARTLITGIAVEQFQSMNRDTETAAELIATARPSIVAFGCTLATLVAGPGFDESLIRRLQEVAHAPATTTATAVLGAFKRLGICRVAIGTPYGDDMNKMEADFLEGAGFTVLDIQGLDLGVEEMHLLPLEACAQPARDVDRPDADGGFLSCTNLKTVPIIDQLEKELGKPVLSSNVATFWDVMRMPGHTQPIKGRGRLLTRI